MPEYGGVEYCGGCLAVTNGSSECLCLVEMPSAEEVLAFIRSQRVAAESAAGGGGCGRTDGRKCCGGSCG